MLKFLKAAPVSVPLLTGLIYTLLTICGKYLSPDTLGDDSVFLAIIVIQIIVFAVPSFLYYGLKGGKLNFPVVSGKISGNAVLFSIFALVVTVFGSMFIKLLLYSGGATIDNGKGYMDELFGSEDGAVGLFLAYALVPALCEEFFFRGIVLSEYKPYGSFNAVLISALYFTMVHFTVDGFLVYFFAGIMLGMVTAVCRSVYPAMAIHLLFNTFTLYSSPDFISNTVFNTGMLFVGFVLLVVTFIGAIFMFSRMEIIYDGYSKACEDMPLPEKSVNHLYLYITPALAVPIAVFIIINTLL